MRCARAGSGCRRTETRRPGRRNPTMTASTDPPPASGHELAADLGVDVASLDKELVEIDMLIGQAKAEAVRHEQKRVQLADKLASAEPSEGADAWAQLVTLTRRSV